MGVSAGGHVHVRPPAGVSFSGFNAEVWQDDRKIGLLLAFNVHGAQGDWEGDAFKYRFEQVPVGEVEIRICLNDGVVRAAFRLEIRARGHIVGDVVADGKPHRESLRLKGTEIAVA